MMDFLKKHIVYVFILMISAASCIERIDIMTDYISSRLVVYGYITTDAKRHEIRITRSAGYFTEDSPAGVSGAAVTISDEDGNIFYLDENPEDPGLYQTADDVRGEEGKTYTLDVLSDAQHYRASARIAHLNDIDSVRLRNSAFSENRVELLVFADMPEGNHYSIFVSVNDSLRNATINRFRVRSNIVNGMTIYVLRKSPEDGDEENNNLLRPGDKVTVNINAISEEYATFISAAQTELSGSIPIFSGPPANVPSNIREVNTNTPALGFFTAFPSRYADVTYQ